MQAWVGHHSPAADLVAYKRKFNADPRIFSFDLNGHGTLQFPETKVYALAGFTDAVLGTMKNLEKEVLPGNRGVEGGHHPRAPVRGPSLRAFRAGPVPVPSGAPTAQ